MSAADVFMSSSPRPARFETSWISSSPPDLPSLERLVKNAKKPALRSGSNAAPIPSQGVTSFTSAASLLRDAPEIDMDTELITKSPSRKSKPSKRRSKHPPTEPLASLDDTFGVSVSASPKDKPWQKFRRKRTPGEDDQGIIEKTRGAKPVEKDGSKQGEARPTTNSTNGSGASRADPEAACAHITNATDEDAFLPREFAVARRTDWTPPRKHPELVILDSDSDHRELVSSVERPASTKEVFDKLLEKYGCKDNVEREARDSSMAGSTTEVLKKRKRIEMLPASHVVSEVKIASPVASPSKQATVKKKPRTITELATAPYARPATSELDLLTASKNQSLLPFFDSDGTMKALCEHQSAVMEHNMSKPGQPAAKTKRKKKTGTVQNPILLSPNSAMKQTSAQDFVFGTSSQLVQENSPQTLRDLQAAIRASNQPDGDPSTDSPDDKVRRLWYAAFRDGEGDLMEADVVDLRNSLPESLLHQPSNTNNEPKEVDGLSATQETVAGVSESIPSLGSYSSSTLARISSHEIVHHATVGNQSSPTTTAQPISSPATRSNEMQDNDVVQHDRPKYELFTDTQLAKQIASYGFKPIKKRETMIARLNQCWNSKNANASSVPGTKRSMQTAASQSSPKKLQPALASSEPSKKPRGRPKQNTVLSDAPPTRKPKETLKKPPGRPKKKAVISTDSPTEVLRATTPLDDGAAPGTPKRKKKIGHEAIVIADSNSECDPDDSLSLSPASDRVFTSPNAIDLSMAEEADMSLTMSPTDQQAALFRLITKAVTSAPRSKDSLNPSWHEKMLLYDPIILEDLAAWLNAGQLSNVGYDGEVSPFDVKKWCESKSVICLWRVGLNGRERKRF